MVMMMPTLIYCADGNKDRAETAIKFGFEYGAQLPNTIYFAPYFVDQDWENPRRSAYMAALEKYKPSMATVLDLERMDQLDEVLSWAEEAAQFVEQVLIIPKVFSIIPLLPHSIQGDVEVVLGYSTPTKFAATEVPVWEFGNRPVHLLGGAPQVQMELTYYLNVVSVDGNYANKMANERCQFWVPGNAYYAANRWWPTLKEWNKGKRWDGDNGPAEAFRRSCENIMAAWRSRPF